MALDASLATVVVAGIAAVGTGVTALASKSAQKRTTEIDRLKVIADAYTAAQGINLEIVKQLREEVERLRELLKDERNTSDKLRIAVNTLELHLGKLESLLRTAGMVVPPAPQVD